MTRSMTQRHNQFDIVRLSITLQEVEPRVARRMDVRPDIDLEGLHLYIQAAMGWDNDHAWRFQAVRYGHRAFWSPEYPDEDLQGTLLDVIDFLGSKQEFNYIYDFGDYWDHRIRIGKIRPARDDRLYPYLVSGAGRCPLEDMGGIAGYREFMRAFDDPGSPYREYFPGLYSEGRSWDPYDAQLDARRASLARYSE